MADIKRKLATVERITEIRPIPDADFIECAVIRGWNVVIKKGEFKVGDLVIYCEIDSVLPEKPEFEFLRPKGFRIQSIRLKNQISQGIIFPLSILNSNEKLDEGTDVTELIGITKYEPPVPTNLSGDIKGNFPSHSIKTDEERIQNLKEFYDEYKKYSWFVTEKVDGTSATLFIFNNEFGVASRNYELKETKENTHWKVAREFNIEEKMRDFMKKHSLEALTLQGELLGEGIQKNKYKIKGHVVKFFIAFNPITYNYFPYNTFFDMMNEMGLDTVPLVAKDFKLPESFDDIIKFADGKSLLADTAREGLVFVTDKPDNLGRLSFKVISNKFILKHNE